MTNCLKNNSMFFSFFFDRTLNLDYLCITHLMDVDITIEYKSNVINCIPLFSLKFKGIR